MMPDFMYKEDTIAAIATPVGEGGVAIVRVSGPDAERIGTTVFARSQGENGKLRSHTLYHGAIRDPKTQNVIDEVLLTVMRKPRSYTGEDVVEVHCHGGAFLVRQILQLILIQGARQAEPGEFTKRAFLNGRMDLTQAEAVLDLIRARTEKAVELALHQMSGELSKWVHELREELLDILVQVEAAIDFPEEEIELLQRPELVKKINNLHDKIINITATYEWGRLFREGARVCICGRPNVGKSSLLNALIGQERVIVTPVPGTTRDVIEESINLGGLPTVLWDTAGIRETEDQIERLGVNLSRQHIEKSDAAIVVLDGSVSLTDEDKVCIRSVESKKSLIVINKNDLEQELDTGQVKDIVGDGVLISVSARNGNGLGELKQSLRELLLGMDSEPPVILSNVRHKAALVRGTEALKSAATALANAQPPEFAAVELNEARIVLEEVIGTVNSDYLLERIFSNFCIGK